MARATSHGLLVNSDRYAHTQSCLLHGGDIAARLGVLED